MAMMTTTIKKQKSPHYITMMRSVCLVRDFISECEKSVGIGCVAHLRHEFSI